MQGNCKLAICGGTPLRNKPWPKWPKVYKETKDNIHTALYSGRWAISGPYVGNECFERKFSKQFATYTGAQYAVPTVNGTSALIMALLALKIRPGDEVLVSGLTWVASATSILALGAVPILVDIEPQTLCMSHEDARKKITSATKAIVIVHLYNSLANLDELIKLANANNLVVIEDCAQAHGAHWNSKHVGTHGQIGCFSMQQSKLLTSGEGGAVITNDPLLYNLLEQVRSDGRLFLNTSEIENGRLELKEVGDIQGHNMCMSEFHAAVLLAGLNYIEKENEKRREVASYLDELLLSEGIDIIKPSPQVTQKTYYNYVFRLDLNQWEGNSIDAIARAISAEIGASINPIYRPLNFHPLYCPLKSPRLASDPSIRRKVDVRNVSLPNAENARATCLSLHHSLFLGDKKDMEDIVKAILKVKKNSDKLLQTTQKISAVSF